MLDSVRPRGALVALAPGGPPTPIGGAAPAPLAIMVVMSGAASVQVETDAPQLLRQGDLALSTARRPVAASSESPDAELMTATYAVEGSVCERVLDGLPGLIVARATTATDALVALLVTEARDHPGGDAVVDRLLDLLVVTALRDWVASSEQAVLPWMAAADDPVVGSALRLMHDDPSAPWTIRSLAEALGVSRSTFAKRFSDLLGEPPMSYLTCWRLCLAADLLRTTDHTLASVARQVGYANPYAFSAAFRRFYGVRPGQHRSLGREGVVAS